MARRRHRHPITRALVRNPNYTPWLILGGVVAAGAAYYLLSKKPAATVNPAVTPSGGGSAAVIPALSTDCQKRTLDILPLMLLTAKDAAVCKANPGAQECLRATANASTITAYEAAFNAACVPGSPPFTGTLPAIPAGLPAVPPACQQTFLDYIALGKQISAAGANPPADLLAKAQTLLAQLTTNCGVDLSF